MSSVASPNGPRTIIVPTNGTGSVSFTLPPGITLDLQSAFAVIDATGAGATTAELTISDQSGVVIAKKRQSETVDAGVTGSATWALRLDDKAAATPASALIVPSWEVSLILENGQAQVMGVSATVADGANVFPFGFGKVALVTTWKLGVGATVEANVINTDTVAHKYAMGPVNVQETATGQQETLRGNTITVPPSNIGSFSFGPRTFGAVLLNLANPLIPTIVNAGNYAITAQFQRTP